MEPQTAKTVGALVGTRTRDLILTKNVLCQLSYKGLTAGGAATPGTHVARAQKHRDAHSPRHGTITPIVPRVKGFAVGWPTGGVPGE